jgi:carbon storage regulator
MLVLSRKSDEAIMIGENIEVKVLEIRGNRVRLGIKAPDSVSVHRLEIHQHHQEFGRINWPVVADNQAASNDLALAH